MLWRKGNGIGKLALMLASAAIVAAPSATAMGKEAAPDLSAIQVSDAEIPFSAYASPEARQALAKVRSQPPEPDFKGDVAAIRAHNTKIEEGRLVDVRRLYPAIVTSETIGGVRTDVILPKQGVAEANRDRVLIALHAGAFMWGAGAGAITEATPIAATGRIKVIAVDYRMAPEHRFPAASEDVAAVYRALLKTHKPENIGIFGCSAGGILAAQSVAWFAARGLPQPGAIVTSCATGAEVTGDSGYLAPMMMGQPMPRGARPLLLAGLPYFQGAAASDPLAFPAVSPEVLAKFPPTLLLAGNRDFSASSLTVMHRRLRAAGTQADLFLFDGLWHAFLLDPTLPESQEAYGIIWRFFDSHLGHRSGSS